MASLPHHGQTPAVHAPHTPRTLPPPPPGLHLEFGSILQVMSISRNFPRARESLPQRINAPPLLPGPPGAHRRGWEEGEMLGGSAEADHEIGPMVTCRSPRRPRHVHAIGMVPARPTPHALPNPRGWTSTRSGWRAEAGQRNQGEATSRRREPPIQRKLVCPATHTPLPSPTKTHTGPFG